MSAGNFESHKIAILPCGTSPEHINGGSDRVNSSPSHLLFLEKRVNDSCVDIWVTGGIKLSVEIDRLRKGLDSLETQAPHEK